MWRSFSDDGFYRISEALHKKDVKREIKQGLEDLLDEAGSLTEPDLLVFAEDNDYEFEDVLEVAKKHFDIQLDEHEDKIPGGLADDADPEDFEQDQLVKGLLIEKEHTDDEDVALEISMDHLDEIDNYYNELEELEAEAKDSSEEDEEEDDE